MSLNMVTVTWNEVDIGQAPLGGYISFQLSAPAADVTDGLTIEPEPAKTYFFTSATGTSDPLVANDNANLSPAGSYYTITVAIKNQQPYTFKTLINFANGGSQKLGFLYANQAQPVQQFAQYLPLPSGTAVAGQVPVATGSGEASAWGNVGMTALGDTIYGGASGVPTRLAGNTSAVQTLLAQTGNGTASAAPVWMYPAAQTLPKPTGVAATDTAAIQAAENALNAFGGGALLFQPGTYAVTGLTKQSNTTWQGAGWLTTFLQLSAGSNTDVIQGANFGTLTLGGTAAGITGWAVRDMCIDGNKANQSGTSYGLRVYGYNFEVANVIIRNCLTDGMYTEWAANSGGITDGMEARYRNLKIHDCGGNGWHDRGPHDSRSWDVTIWAVGSTAKGYWAEGSVTTTVAAGSSGVDVTTFAGAGTLNVASTLNYPSASISATQGAISVATSAGTAVITYTGTTATSFTGCTTVSGTGTLSAGGAVTWAVGGAGGYGASGNLHTQMHVYAQPLYDYVLDCQVHLLGCIGEVTRAGGAMVLIRGGNAFITGGYYVIYSGAPQVGCGIQIGDTVNPAGVSRIDTYVSGLAGTSAATAALNIVNDGGNNSIDLLVFQSSGQAVWGNSGRSRVRIMSSGSGVYATDTGNSQVKQYGSGQWFVPPSAGQAWRLSGSGVDYLNLSTSGNRWEHVGGMSDAWYADQYVTRTVQVNGATGAVQAGTAAGLGGSTYSGSGAPSIPGSVAGDKYNRTDVSSGRSTYVATGSNTWGPLQVADTAAGALGMFGTGADGAAVLDGTATVAWASKAGSTYTMTRDAQLTSLTVTGGATLKTAQFRVFCQGTVTVTSTGTVSNAGNSASGSTAGGAGSGGSLSAGRAGGAGGTGTNGAGGNGAGANFGNAAGAGGAGTSGAAGSGGTVSQSGTTISANVLQTPFAMLSGIYAFSSSLLALQGGPGGGGGGADASGNAGGGGGGGGGIVPIAAWALVNNGTITAAGGTGANGTGGNAGGGGGGSAGTILTYTLSAASGSGTYVTSGGSPGSGAGTGSAGTAGGAGLLVQVVLS